MNNVICIYHSRDLDGWMSAAIVKKWVIGLDEPLIIKNVDKNTGWEEFNIPRIEEKEVEASGINRLVFLGWDYGDEIPNMSEYDEVIMVDISFPGDIMEVLYDNNKLLWIDHHSSAIKTSDSHGFEYNKAKGSRDIDFAACELTWQYFFPEDAMPEIVRLLGRYDCFGHKPQWKEVIGYEGFYEVSNQGKVRSIDRTITEKNTNVSKNLKGKSLSASISNRGYLVVNLFKDNKGKMKNIHNLVANAFIVNPENKDTVNHKDSNRLNNNLVNLEWNTYLENNEHSIQNGDKGYPVLQLDTDGVFVERFESIRTAEVSTGISNQNITKVCKGERKKAGGYKWEYGLRKSTHQFIPQDEETKVMEFQYGARQEITNYTEAYKWLTKADSNTIGELSNIELIHRKGKIIYEYVCSEADATYKKSFPITFESDTLFIHSDGNVGIGTSPPDENISVLGGSFPDGNIGLGIPNPDAEFYITEGEVTGSFKVTGVNTSNLKTEPSGNPGEMFRGTYKFLAVNEERFNPINFGIDYHEDGYDGFACFWYNKGKWNWSLYNDNGEVDCSVIAKTFGGGGHPGASGFVLTDDEHNDLMKKK